MASAAQLRTPTPVETVALGHIRLYFRALGESCPAGYVARKMGVSPQVARDYFNALYELGLLRSPGAPATPTTLRISQVHSASAVGHAAPVQRRAVETIEFAPFAIRAALGDSVDAEARTVDVVFSTGAPVERFDWMTGKRYLETLSLDPAHVRLDRLNAGGPLLDSHSGYSVSGIIGSVVPGSAQLVKKEARATVRFSKRPSVEEVFQDVRDKIVRHVSVGYRVYKFEETDGKGNALPVRKAIDWEPFEISMVAIPADPKASTRSANVETNLCEVTRATEEKMDEPTPTPTPAAPTPASPVDVTAVRKAAAEDERKRALAIRQAVATAKLATSVADAMIERGVSIDVARAEILEQLASASDKGGPAANVVVVADASDKARAGMIGWLIRRAGVEDLIRAAAKAKPDHPALKDAVQEPGEFRGMTLFDLAQRDLSVSGVRTVGLDKQGIVGAFFARAGVIGQSVSDFAVALENVLHKVLLAAYTITPDTWSRFCSVGSVVDFRAHPRYRSGYLGRLDKVLDNGEFVNKAIPDANKESLTAYTRGNILGLSRQAIINDDMSVFSRIAAQLGRAAKLSIEMDVYDLLALNAGLGPAMNDGLTLFHANHNNLGAGAALSVASIDADRVVLASQKDPAANEILDLRPAALVIAVGLGGQARVINQAQFDTDVIANKPMMTPNKVVGLFRDIVDTPRLAGTRRYMFTDPLLFPVIEVAFLNGVQEPFLEMQNGWRVDGVEWKGRIDYGVAAIEFRGAVTNAGV